MAGSRRKKLFTCFLVAATLSAGLLGTVDATQQVAGEQLTTGHSEYVDASSSYNGCFAGLAGLILQRVTWFNGQTLFTRADSGGDKWVYVTEHLGDSNGDGYNETTGFEIRDPSEENLYRTNKTYKFADENNPSKKWIVREYFALRDQKNTTHVHVEGQGEEVERNEEAEKKEKFYVFAVKVADNAIQDPTIGKDYNFAMVIDTCRFKSSKAGETNHTGENGTTGDPVGQHEEEEGNHTHDLRSVDIWVGGKPSGPAGQTPVPDDRGNESTTEDAKDGRP